MSIALRYNSRRARAAILNQEAIPWLERHPRKGYLRQAYLSVLPWVDREELRWLHWCKCAWSAATGVEHVLDHEVPLNHPRVCGLTVPWNLRLVPREVNAFKGGHWCEDQLPLL